METETSNAVTGKITHCTGFDRKQLHEIDMRVGARLAEREILRGEYVRGILDCFYIVVLLAWAAYLYWYFSGDE